MEGNGAMRWNVLKKALVEVKQEKRKDAEMEKDEEKGQRG